MSLLTSAPISALAVELLRRQLVLVGTVRRVPGDEFSGPSGGVVTLRVSQPRSALEQETPGATITFTDIDEVPVNVELRHFYDACRVTDEDLSLGIQSFGAQVLLPQVVSVAERAEDQVANVLNGLTPDAAVAWPSTPDPEADEATILAAREALSIDGTPQGNRWLAVAPDIASRILAIDKVVTAPRNDQRSALEDARIGRLYGFDIIESAALTPGTAAAYHASALAWGNRPPVHPGGGADSTTATDGGVSLRHVLAFDASRLSTASVVSVFAGASLVTEDEAGEDVRRVVKIGTAS